MEEVSILSRKTLNWNLERPSSPQGDHIARYIFAKRHVLKKLVLDAGCGAAHGVYLLASDCQAAIGIDISVAALTYARRCHSRDKIEFLAQDVTRLGFKSETFDVVLSFEVIEHLKNHRVYLREIRRVLKDGGTLLISTPNKKIMSPGRKRPLWKWHHVEFYSHEFETLLKEFFENIRMFGETTTNPHWLARDRKAITLHRYARIIPSVLIRLVPMKVIQALLWNVPPVGLDEIEISEDCLDRARTFIAVCTKRSLNH